MKRLLALSPLLLLALTGTAHADSATQVAQALQNSPVYQQQGLDLVDVAGLQSTLSGQDPPVYVAVLAAAAASSADQAHARATEIGKDLGQSDAVVLVITANKHLGAAEGPGAASRGVQSGADLQAVLAEAKGKPFDKADVTALATSFAQRVHDEAGAAGGSSSSGSSDTFGGARTTNSGGGHGGAYFLGALVLLGGDLLFHARGEDRSRYVRPALRARGRGEPAQAQSQRDEPRHRDHHGGDGDGGEEDAAHFRGEGTTMRPPCVPLLCWWWCRWWLRRW